MKLFERLITAIKRRVTSTKSAARRDRPTQHRNSREVERRLRQQARDEARRTG